MADVLATIHFATAIPAFLVSIICTIVLMSKIEKRLGHPVPGSRHSIPRQIRMLARARPDLRQLARWVRVCFWAQLALGLWIVVGLGIIEATVGIPTPYKRTHKAPGRDRGVPVRVTR